jgi:hypothetical protein
MAKAEQRSSSRSKIQPPEPSVPTLEAWNMSAPGKSPLKWSKFQNSPNPVAHFAHLAFASSPRTSRLVRLARRSEIARSATAMRLGRFGTFIPRSARLHGRSFARRTGSLPQNHSDCEQASSGGRLTSRSVLALKVEERQIVSAIKFSLREPE